MTIDDGNVQPIYDYAKLDTNPRLTPFLVEDSIRKGAAWLCETRFRLWGMRCFLKVIIVSIEPISSFSLSLISSIMLNS